MSDLRIEVCSEQLTLLPERALYWNNKNTLVVSDLHLGKAGHFRKHGIPISKKIHLEDLNNLALAIQRLKVKNVILLGDLFHSFKNREWDDWLAFVDYFKEIQFTLVKGNHDILDNYPTSLAITPILEISPFSFTHEMEQSDYYNFSGHVHPGFRLHGAARQGMTFPCFIFSERHAILPAFGQFTGLKKVRRKANDRIYGIADDKVLQLV